MQPQSPFVATNKVTTSLADTIQAASTHLTPPPPMPSIQPQPLFVTISLATTIQVASTHLTRGL